MPPLSLGALSSSSILDSHGSKYRNKLNSYLDPVLQTTGRSRFVRCWHAKTDGWAASTFHSNCDGKGPTVTIVQVGSYVFGGYTGKSWGGMYHFRTALMARRSSLPTANVFPVVASPPPKNNSWRERSDDRKYVCSSQANTSHACSAFSCGRAKTIPIRFT